MSRSHSACTSWARGPKRLQAQTHLINEIPAWVELDAMSFQATCWLKAFGEHYRAYSPDLDGLESFEHRGITFQINDVISTSRFTGRLVGISKPVSLPSTRGYHGPTLRQTLLFIVIRDREGFDPPGTLSWIFFWPEGLDGQSIALDILETLAGL